MAVQRQMNKFLGTVGRLRKLTWFHQPALTRAEFRAEVASFSAVPLLVVVASITFSFLSLIVTPRLLCWVVCAQARIVTYR